MITHDLIIKMLDFVKDPSCGTFEYGKWGTLNMEQRQLIRRLCESWLILDEATNKQMLEIERLNNIIKEAREILNMQLAFTSSYQLNYQSAMSIIEEAKSTLRGVDKN